MPLLHNIAKFNNTVVIRVQCTCILRNLHSILSFRITEGVTRLVSPDIGHSLSDSWAPMAFHGLSAHASAVSPAAALVSQHGLRKAPVSLSYIAFKNTCNNVVKLHVTMHGYIVKVLDVNIYIYMNDEYLLYKYFCRNMK